MKTSEPVWKPTTRRRLLAGVAGAGGAAALAGCGAAGRTPDAPPAAPAGNVTFWHWGSQDYFVRYRALADEFQKRSPKVTVEVVRVDPMSEKLVPAFTSGTPPDTFVIDFNPAQGFAKRGFVEVLEDRAKKSRLLKLNEYPKLATDGMSYKGKLIGLPGVGIPGGSAPNLIFYNSEHFRKAGLATPYDLWKQDKWTWDAFLQACLKLVQRDAAGKLTQVPVSGYQHRLWMNAAGGKEVDDVIVPTKALYDQPAAVKALQFLQDLRHKHRVEPVSGTRNEIGLADDDAFMQGRLSMRMRWTTGINVYRAISSFKWGMAPYPKDATYANDYTAAGLTIAKGAKPQDAGWVWIEWASSPEGQKVDAVTTTGVPFSPEAVKVFTDSLKGIASLETPDAPGDLIAKGKHSFLRLLCVDETQINRELIEPEMNKLWANEVNALTVGKSIAQAINDFLKTHPQG